MIKFITFYSGLLTNDGILVIEDIQSYDWIELLIGAVPNELKQYIKVYDLRKIKQRYDDIVFVIDKTSTILPKVFSISCYNEL